VTPERMAQIYAAAFPDMRPWSAAEIADLLCNPMIEAITGDDAFGLTQTIAGESELLTLAVHPGAQGKGTGRALLREWLGKNGVQVAFLEVAADNTAAIALYHSTGFAQEGLRPAYYPRKNAPPADAILMRRQLP
jgi:ribosomal-protein-alanine N-acetyltransferase